MADTGKQENPQTEERRYKAFISYRHKPLDRQAAEMIQKKIESFRVPKEFRDRTEGDRLGIVFRDEDELPASSSLSDSITYALDHTEYLIVICTPDLPQSRWCEQEIKYFLETHSRDKIIAVLVDGEPDISFSPYLLNVYDSEGNVVREVEPLAANIKGPDHTIDKKAFKKEIVRLYAALIGCPFDSLWQRERRRRTNTLIGLLSGVAAVLTVFLALVISNNMKITEKNREITEKNDEILKQNEEIEQKNDTIIKQNTDLKKQMSSLYVDQGYSMLEEFDLKEALENAVLAYGDGEDGVYDLRTEKLLTEALGSYEYNGIRNTVFYEQSSDIVQMAVSCDGSSIFVLDNEGVIRCIDAENAEVIWQASFGKGSRDRKGTDVYVPETGDRVIVKTLDRVRAFNVKTGEMIWEYYSKFSSGYPFQLMSPDGSRFSLIDLISGKYTLVTIDAYSGKTVSAVTLPSGNFSPVGACWYSVGCAYSPNSALIGISYEYSKSSMGTLSEAGEGLKDIAESAGMNGDDIAALFQSFDVNIDDLLDLSDKRKSTGEDETEESIYLYLVIDPASGEIVRKYLKNDRPSPTKIYFGMTVENDTGNMLCLEYSSIYGGMIATCIDWDKDIHERKLYNQILNESDSWAMGISAVKPLQSDDLLITFMYDTMFIFNRSDGKLRKNYKFDGNIVSASFYDRENEIVDFYMSTGDAWRFDLEHQGTAAYKRVVQTHLYQDGVMTADSLKDREIYFTVRNEAPGKIIRAEKHSDTAGSVFEGRSSVGLYMIPGSDCIMSFDPGDEDTVVTVYDSSLKEIKASDSFEGYYTNLFDGRLCPFGEDAFLYNNKIFRFGAAEPEVLDGSLDDGYLLYDSVHFLLGNGDILSYTSGWVYIGGSLYKRCWINGNRVWQSTIKDLGISFPYDINGSSSIMTLVSDSGLIAGIGYEHVKGSSDIKRVIKCFDPYGIALYTADMPFESDDGLICAMGRTEPLFLAYDGEGKLYVMDIKSGSVSVIGPDSRLENTAAVCFSQDDAYICALSGSGKLSVIRAADGEIVYSGYPGISKLPENERIEADVIDEGKHLCVRIPNVSGDNARSDWFMFDTSSWDIVQHTIDVLMFNAKNRMLYMERDYTRTVACRVHTLNDLLEEARGYIAEVER